MSQDKVVVVNGKKVTTQEFSELVNRRTEEMQAMFRQQYGMSLPEGYSARINKDVFDQIVQEMVISDAAANVGVQVSKEELTDLLQGDHIAPQIQQMFPSKAELLNFLQVIFNDDLSQYPENVIEQIQDYRTKWIALEQDVKKQRGAVRIRTIQDKKIFTLKIRKDEYTHYEFEKEISAENINEIEDPEILNWFNQYQIPKNLHPTASFTTLRNVYAFENGELCLDKTYYKNHTDYEIEYEYTSDHDGIHFFNSILEKYGLKWVKNCPSKIARALND